MDVSAKLIEQQYQRQASCWGVRPVAKLAIGSLRNIVCEFLDDFGIKVGVVTKPDIHSPVDLRR